MDRNNPYSTSGAWNPFAMRSDVPKMVKGHMKAVFSAVYILERDMLDDCIILNAIAKVVSLFSSKIRYLTHKDSHLATIAILDNFEQAIAKARKATIVKTLEEYNNAVNDGLVAVIHAIEGAHTLSGDLANLDEFYKRGMRMMTVAHMYNNPFVESIGGIPYTLKILGCFKNCHEHSGGLTVLGKELIHRMIDMRIAIDLCHCTLQSRKDIYAIAKAEKHKDPVILFSHAGFRDHNNSHPMSPDADEVKTIAELGGVIGVIFMNYWLANPSSFNPKKDLGFPLIAHTIQSMIKHSGIDCLSIGSDFDGFTDPPNDYTDISYLEKFRKDIKKDQNLNLSLEDVDKIAYLNAENRIIKRILQ
jgi:membrane dipeptidase